MYRKYNLFYEFILQDVEFLAEVEVYNLLYSRKNSQHLYAF